MADKKYTYILDFKGKTDQMQKQMGGLKGMLKGAALAASALFAADKIMDAAKAVGEYAKQISGVRNEVAKLTGMQGAALDATTGQVQAIATAYDQDVNETLKATNALMKTFGESNRAAFDIMNAGFAGTANSNEDFLKQISEYSTHFKEAGMSAAQMTAIISEGNKMGVFDDKAADAIKEGGIRLREMTNGTKDALDAIGLSSTYIEQAIKTGTISMFDAMKMVSERLEILPPQSAAVGTALADIFGGPGEDAVQFIRNLKDVNTNLDDIVAGATDSTKAQMEWANALADFNTMGAQVFGGTNNMITSVKATMLNWVNAAIKGAVSVINYFIDLYNESMVFRAGIEWIALTFKHLWNTVKTVFSMIVDYFKGMGKLWKAIFTGDFGAIKDIIKETFSEVANDGKEWGKTLADNFNTAVENTITPKAKIEAISLSVDEAAAVGFATGQAYGNGVKSGMAARKGNVPLPGMTAIAPTSVDDGAFASNIVTEYSSIKTENEALAASFEELSQSAANSFNTIAGAIGGAAGGWMGFVGTLFDQIPQLITQIAALTGAQQASSMAVVGAKQSEAMAGAAAGASKLPFPANLIAMLGAVAAVVSIFASIPKFATGGIVPGGSFSGDKMLIRANSGEEVLTRNDPRHSFNQRAAMSGGSVNVQLEQSGIEISGETLRILLKKVERKMALRN